MRLNVSGGGKLCGILLIGSVFFGFGAAKADDSVAVSASKLDTAPADGAAVTSFKKTFKTWETEFTVTAGMRSDDLDWSIGRSSTGGKPNVLSELSWSDVDSRQVTLTNRSRLQRHIYLRGSLNYAWIHDGNVRDSDYGEDNRTGEWSRSMSETNGDEMWDLSVGGGYAFMLLNDRLLIAPLFGLSYHKQNLRITNGTQIISDDNPFSSSSQDNPPPVGPLSSQLNSTYFARWMGPWIGCDLSYRPTGGSPRIPPMVFNLSVELHWADYYGEGNWNLRSDLAHPKSFEHHADGYGLCISGEWRVNLALHWDLTFSANFQHWSTNSGTDRKLWSAGGVSTTRMNGVDWDSSSFMVGAAYYF